MVGIYKDSYDGPRDHMPGPYRGETYLNVIVSTILGYIVSTGLYALYFEYAKFGWPKEKSWIKFRRIINYIGLFIITFKILLPSEILPAPQQRQQLLYQQGQEIPIEVD